MKLAIYGSRRQDAYLDKIEAFLSSLDKRSDEAVMHTKLYQYLQHIMPMALKAVRRVTDTLDFDADFAVSIGGDGSFLRTAAWVADKQIPVLGVNTGHLGFLASLDINDLPNLAGLLSYGKFVVEPRSLLQVALPGVGNPAAWPYALNEVTFTKAEMASIVSVRAHVDGIELANYRADGLIVATPTGSTAYNLSVGGPILQPNAPVFVLSPIAAHSLSMRPLVVADSSVLTFDVDCRKPFFCLSLDGRSYTLPISQSVELRKAPFCVNVVRLEGHNFAETLKNKLTWG
jgi:NAD+ kinase